MNSTQFQRWMVVGLLVWGVRAQAAPISWSSFGEAATGDWHTATNWTPNQVPGAGDDVLITNQGVRVVLTNFTANLNSLLLSGPPTYTNQLVFSNWATYLQAITVAVGSNGLMTSANSYTNVDGTNRVYVLCSNLVIEAGGAIAPDRTGYRGTIYPANGPGGGVQ
ncbi:MAG: hypothetical protein HY343_06195, partial [Lentisphaerae bacterium]|nr:hypothetical protein [Lentisphaerota bacterium]